jgi:hypothetical protein
MILFKKWELTLQVTGIRLLEISCIKRECHNKLLYDVCLRVFVLYFDVEVRRKYLLLFPSERKNQVSVIKIKEED